VVPSSISQGLLNWFWSRISSGLIEGTSSLVKAAKAKARTLRILIGHDLLTHREARVQTLPIRNGQEP
jgi:hypothetical protein